MNKKILVAYFSATGTTARMAKEFARITNAELQEIKPAVPYTDADLDWRDVHSRSSVEMHTDGYRPELAEKARVDAYDTVLLCFPIWWYVAPGIVNSYLESANFDGKRIVLFATSGSSGFGHTARELQVSCPNAQITEGKVFHGVPDLAKLQTCVSELPGS